MFTGIITHLGEIHTKTKNGLRIKADKKLTQSMPVGTSVSVNGICLTVVKCVGGFFWVDVMPETVAKTNLRYLHAGNPVNLELAATPQSFLSGHIVTGHIDTISKLVKLKNLDNSRILTFDIKRKFSKYIVSKGSITVNGISLTVIDVQDSFFTVGIIPHTWTHTMLHTIQTGDFVNIEVDILSKYIERFIR